jgi:hypothetical protein
MKANLKIWPESNGSLPYWVTLRSLSYVALRDVRPRPASISTRSAFLYMILPPFIWLAIAISIEKLQANRHRYAKQDVGTKKIKMCVL